MNLKFKGKKIVIMGLGINGGGVEAAKFFCRRGSKVIVTDLKKRSDLKKSIKQLKNFPGIKFILGKHKEKDFSKADLIIKNPAVPWNSPYLKIAKQNNIPVYTDIDIFFDLVNPKKIVGITGTKGKSTVSTLCYLFLKSKYQDVLLAGNIGISPLKIIPKVKEDSIIILELSSFELENLKKSPHIAVITSLFPDHLDRYENFQTYLEAKNPIFKYQKESDILVLNSKDDLAKKFSKGAKSKIYFFEEKEGKNDKGINYSNLSAAIAVAKIFKISKKNIEKVVSNFKGVPNRQELVAVKNGVRYINDTAATTPQSVMFAIKNFKNRFPKNKIILIAGGMDKKLDYCDLAKEIKKKVNYLVLLPGSASDKIKKEIDGFKNVCFVKSMEEAVEQASERAEKNDIILLSPGAASFNLFKNEFDRGEKFIKEVKK